VIIRFRVAVPVTVPQPQHRCWSFLIYAASSQNTTWLAMGMNGNPACAALAPVCVANATGRRQTGKNKTPPKWGFITAYRTACPWPRYSGAPPLAGRGGAVIDSPALSVGFRSFDACPRADQPATLPSRLCGKRGILFDAVLL